MVRIVNNIAGTAIYFFVAATHIFACAKSKNLHHFFNFYSSHSISMDKNVHGILKISSLSKAQNFGKLQNGPKMLILTVIRWPPFYDFPKF